ncbi:MAG: monovalent cation/H+ antiporter subunit D family protein [Alphaproteobacteria bacterium]|nr:monovalent cation/H+ antiporter subunit D family protein [Alphaproteobacteria bacterium]
MSGAAAADYLGQLMIYAVAIPALVTLPIVVFGRWPNLREAATLAAAGLLFVTVLRALWLFEAIGGASVTLWEVFPGLSLSFTVEPLGMLFALVASALWIVNSIYSIGYMRGNNEANQTRFYACFAIAISSTMWVAFSGNMLTLFFGYEVLTLSTYPLVTHSGKPEAIQGGRTYLGLLLATSIGLLLLGVLMTWQVTGTLDFTPGGILAGPLDAGAIDGRMIGLLLFLYMFGIGKAALMPIHRWLPAAMVAPTPVSALLHAVAVVKAGVFTVVKVIVYVFGVDLLANTAEAGWLLYVAGFTIIMASIIALRQDNLKRRLAYSTVSQLSYVIMAAAILAPLSVVGAAMHIAAHAFGKITLFFAAGSIYTAAHKTEVSQLDGIGWRMPWTMGAFAVGSLSMIGVPPTVGFTSKWFILQGAMESGRMTAVAVIVASTLLNAAYFVPIVYRAFFREPPGDAGDHAHGEAPLPIVIALTATAAGTILFFFLPQLPLSLARQLMIGG